MGNAATTKKGDSSESGELGLGNTCVTGRKCAKLCNIHKVKGIVNFFYIIYKIYLTEYLPRSCFRNVCITNNKLIEVKLEITLFRGLIGAERANLYFAHTFGRMD